MGLDNISGRELIGWIVAGIAALSTLIQIAPIKINPWSAIAKWIGRAINADVLKELNEVKRSQRDAQAKLERHIRTDDERNADMHRSKILQFNNELLRDIHHTREDFIEVLAEIDCYERYCETHPEYQNNRAVHAIANIGRVYDERLRKRDFLGEGVYRETEAQKDNSVLQ